MKPRLNLRLIVLGVLCASGAFANAQQEYVYETKLQVTPRPDYNVEQEVEKLLAQVTQGDNLSKEQMEENRRMLRPQLARNRDGFTAAGRTVIAAGRDGRYVETIIPDLATGTGKVVRYLVRDKHTYAAPLGPTEAAHVSAADTGNSLSGPGDLLLLARHPLGGKITATKPVAGGIRRTFELTVTPGTRTWVELDSTADGKRIKGAVVYMASPSGGRVLMTRYTVADYLPSGEPRTVKAERFSKDRVYQRETYRLVDAHPAKEQTYKDILTVGQKVVDTRLGTDPSYQLYYTLEGDLPTDAELRRMQQVQNGEATPVRVGGAQINSVPFGVGALVLAAGIALYVRSRRTA